MPVPADDDGLELSPEAREYGRRMATALFRGRKGHGGAPISTRVLRPADIVAICAMAFDHGRGLKVSK